jgi:hypothetical protein
MSAGVPNNNIFRNVGAMYNQGIEASLTLGIINAENGGWDLTINASTLKIKFQECQTDSQRLSQVLRN